MWVLECQGEIFRLLEHVGSHGHLLGRTGIISELDCRLMHLEAREGSLPNVKLETGLTPA